MPQVLIDSVSFEHSLPSSELAKALARLEHARATTKKLTRRLRKEIAAGKKARQEYVVEWLTCSPEALLVSAIAANKKLKPEKRQPLERCFEISQKLTFDVPLKETVPVHPKVKKTGAVRMIHDHGLQHRAGQDLVARVIGEYLKPRSFQFTRHGVHDAIAEAKKQVLAGYVHAARLDVVNFYGSFVLEKLLPELPLPKETVEHVVVGRHMKTRLVTLGEKAKMPHSIGHAPQDLLLLSRLGIPHGSGCSPIVGMFCMSRLAWSPMPGVVLINYVDDFLLLAISAQLLEQAIEKLTEAVGNLPGGNFTLKLVEKAHLAKGIAFLGHQLHLSDSGLTTAPTDFNVCNFHKKLTHLENAIWPLLTPLKEFDPEAAKLKLADLCAFVMGWTGAFSECDEILEFQGFAMSFVHEYLATLGMSLEELKSILHPDKVYHPSDYAFAG